MARPARGAENLEWAREVVAQAQTVEQLRQAQAVVLPLDYGLSLEQTARAIGRSAAWTCRLRNRFLAGEIVGDGQRQSRGGRRRQNMTTEQEREVLAPFLDRARTGGILVVGQVKAELEATWGAPWRCPRSTTCCTATAGASSPRTSATRKVTRWLSRSGKKTPRATRRNPRALGGQGPIKLMFQDEARFGRINDVRRCWAPRPMRPLCQAMLTHEYTYAYAAVDVQTESSTR